MLSILLLTGSALAASLSDYPTPLRIPPENPEWTAIVQKRIGTGAPSFGKCNARNQWAFTFDDGPSASTAIVLDALAQRKQKATFFIVGSQVFDNEDMLKRIVREGHFVGIHTWSHPSLNNLTIGQIVAELGYTAKIVNEVTGVTPTIMRPPYGDENDRVRQVATAMGFSLVKWTRDSNDWLFSTWTAGTQVREPFKPNDTPDAISRQFISWAAPPQQGTISLQHDIYPLPSAQAGPAIDNVVAAGFQLVSVADCIGKPAYSDESLVMLGVLAPTVPVVSNTKLADASNGTNSTTKADNNINNKTSDAFQAGSALAFSAAALMTVLF